MNKLIILSGVPGSGKSYFSTLLKSKRQHIYIVSSDRLRKEMLGSQRDLSDEKTVWKVLYELVKAYSVDENAIVVLDSTNIYSKHRLELIDLFKPYFKKIHLIFFSIKRETLINQNEERNLFLNRFIQKLYSYQKRLGYKNGQTCRGSYLFQIKHINERILRILCYRVLSLKLSLWLFAY